METVSAKAVSAIAVVVMTATVLGAFSIQKSAFEEEHFRKMCRSLAESVDALSNINARTTINVTFAQGAGIHLDGAFRGKPYIIEFRAGSVIFSQDGLTAVDTFIKNVCLWNLSAQNTTIFSTSELDLLNSENRVLKTVSGHNFRIDREMLVIDGWPSYRTFVKGA